MPPIAIGTPFALHEGVITAWPSAERCKLLLWMMGRDIVVEVAATDVVALNRETEVLHSPLRSGSSFE
jgi:hypothetical protein